MEALPTRNDNPPEQPEAPRCPNCDEPMKYTASAFLKSLDYWECGNILCEDYTGPSDETIDALREYAIEADNDAAKYCTELAKAQAEVKVVRDYLEDARAELKRIREELEIIHTHVYAARKG